MLKRRIIALVILIIGALLAFVIFHNKAYFAKHPFRLGLDLSGGTHLLYKADISALPSGQVDDSMAALRDVIERRINAFGVAEPVVEVQTSNATGVTEHRLSIDLPGVTDVSEAIKQIGQTPFLEFRVQSTKTPTATVDANGTATIDENSLYEPTELTGKYLKSAQLQFNPNTSEPTVVLQFDDTGSKLFEQITKANIGKTVAIYLDGQVISAPTVNEAISGGQAVISGNFTPQTGKELVGRLNSGALPVPISLVSTQTIGATLGTDAAHAGVKAAIIGFLLVALFLLAWYRLTGFVAIIGLALYVIITLTLYRALPVFLSAAGIAGFIISIGMAVDANILIFERFREERAKGRVLSDAIEVGFSRAWSSIRDANIASLIISVILFGAGTSLMKGFALTFGLGVLISMLSAITITRALLRALPQNETNKFLRVLYKSGFSSKKSN